MRDGVVKRGKSWSYVVRVPDPTSGLSKPRWVGGFATEAAAKEARDQARVAARRGEYVNRSGVLVADYLRQWIGDHETVVKPKTHEDYRRIIESYVVPHIGRMRLQAVRPTTLTSLYKTLRASGGTGANPLSVRTVQYVHAVLRKALNDAVTVDKILPSNPALTAKRPRSTEGDEASRSHVWEAHELSRFLSAVQRERLSPLFRLAAYTGARRGELLFLRWGDTDLQSVNPHILVRGSVSIVGGKRVEGSTKTGRSRVVGLDKGTAEILKVWRNAQANEREQAGASWRGDNHVFLTALGSQLPPDRPGEVMRRVVAGEASLPRIKFHGLRHTHATLLLRAGVPVHVVAARLGHRDPAMTLRVYAHVLHDQGLEVGDTFARALGEGA